MRRSLFTCLLMTLCLLSSAQRNVARSHLMVAKEYFAKEDYVRASDLYQKVLNTDGAIMPYKLNACNELAHCYVALGEYEKALSSYQSAMRYIGDDDDNDAIMLGLADLYVMCGRYQEADSVLSRIVCLHNFQNRNLYRSNILFRQHRNREAVDILNKIIEGLGDSSDMVILLQNRGYILSQSDDADTLRFARQDLLTALGRMSQGKDSYYITLSNLAIVEARVADYDSALFHIEKVVDWFAAKYQPSRKYSDYIIALRKKAEILMLKGDMPGAENAYKAFYEKELEYVKHNFATMTEQNRLDFWKKEKPLLSDIFALEGSAPEFLYDVALLRREVALLGGGDSIVLADKVNRRLGIRGGDIRKKLNSDEIAIEFVRYDKYDSTTKKKTAWYGAIVVPSSSAGRKVAFVPLWAEGDLNGFRIRRHTLLDAVCAPYNKSVKEQMYEDKKLADFIWSSLSDYVRDAKRVYFAPDGLLNMLAIEYLYPLCDSVGNQTFYRLTTTANILDRSNRTFEKGRLLIVGGLDYNALGDTISNGTDVNHDAVNYLLQFASIKTGFFKYLAYSRKEIQSIDSIVSSEADTAYVKSEEALKKDFEARKYNKIHLATHGYALNVSVPSVPEVLRDSISEDKSMLASGIALSGANIAYKHGDREDGIVSARELCDMDLRNVDIVVVSACQSAQGAIGDEGPAGIVRGLKKAGAGAVVATLWEISDEATGVFMTKFYEVLDRTQSPTTALYEAQNFLKTGYKKEYMNRKTAYSRIREEQEIISEYTPFATPYYWAAFILIDDI